MAPTAKVEQKRPGTLPADFGEWDSGDTPATLPDDFDGFDVSHKTTGPKKPLAPSKSDRQATRTSEDRMGQSKSPVPVKGRAGETKSEVSSKVQAQALENTRVQDKGNPKSKMLFIAAGSVLLLVVGAPLVYFNFQPKQRPQRQTVTVQPQPKQGVAKPSPMTPVSPSAPEVSESTPAATTPAPRIEPETMDSQLNAPRRISRDIKSVGEQQAPGMSATGMEGMSTGGEMVSSVFSGKHAPVVKAEPRMTNISAGVAKGLLLRQTPPVYPPLAKSSHVSGTVILKATISQTGTIEDLHVVSGSQMLRQAAVDAVKTWRYKPYQLNNQPVEVETTVDVIFALGN
jgi:protein TonB